MRTEKLFDSLNDTNGKVGIFLVLLINLGHKLDQTTNVSFRPMFSTCLRQTGGRYLSTALQRKGSRDILGFEEVIFGSAKVVGNGVDFNGIGQVDCLGFLFYRLALEKQTLLAKGQRQEPHEGSVTIADTVEFESGDLGIVSGWGAIVKDEPAADAAGC